MGIPRHELAKRLPEREFVLYQQYAAKRVLPTRRLELYLAQLCSVIAKVHGNADAEIRDFLLDPIDGDGEETEDVAGAFEFNPRNKG